MRGSSLKSLARCSFSSSCITFWQCEASIKSTSPDNMWDADGLVCFPRASERISYILDTFTKLLEHFSFWKITEFPPLWKILSSCERKINPYALYNQSTTFPLKTSTYINTTNFPFQKFIMVPQKTFKCLEIHCLPTKISKIIRTQLILKALFYN